MAKKPFERIGNYLRFKQLVDGRERGFEFYHEPFEGELADNIELFAGMFESGEPARCQQGVNLLAQSRDERAVPHLIKALLDNKFTGRAIAAAGLANFPGNKKVFKALVGAMYSADYMLTITAINALGRLAMPRAKKPLRKVLARCLRRDELFTTEKTAGPAAVLALACISALFELGDQEHRPLLLRFLAHPAWEVKHHAVKVFVKFPDANAETLLRRLAEDANPFVRLAAAEALIKLGDDGFYETVEQMTREPEAGMRAAAYTALAGTGSKAGFDAMERALSRETDAGLRLEIAGRLRADGRGVDTEILREGLEHENPFIRQSAIKVTADHGTPEDLALLREELETEPDEFLREQMEKRFAGRPGKPGGDSA